MALGLLLLLLYVAHARQTRFPLLDLRLFAISSFNAGVVGGFLFRIGIGAIPFLLPLMLQLGFGLTPFQSGLLTCATALGAIFMKTVAARILQQFGFRRVLVVNALFTAASLAVFALFSAATSHVLMVGVFLLGGCFRSLQFTSLNAISYANIDTPDMSQATSLAGVMQQLAAGMGVTVGAFALQSASTLAGHAHVLPIDFSWAFVAVSLVSLCSVFWFIRLPRNSGAELAGRSAAA
jgi:MFS family permease